MFKDTWLDGSQSTQTAPPHRKSKPVLTYQERTFFWTLVHTIAAEYSVLTKVCMAGFIELAHQSEDQMAHNQQIQSMYVDFLLCQKSTFEPLLVIELEDASGSDPFKIETLAAADISYLRIPVQKEYNILHLKQQIHEKIGEHPKPTSGHHWYG